MVWCSFVPDFFVAQFDGPSNEITSTSMPTDGSGGGGVGNAATK
jgi:hypothetical protein